MESRDVVLKVEGLLQPIAAAQGAVVEEVAFNVNPNPPALTITVDLLEGTDPLSSDQVASLACAFSKALDDNDPIDGQYNLEVSTPGVEAPMTNERQYRRKVGRMVRIHLSEDVVLEGTLENVTDNGIELNVEGSATPVAFDRIRSARAVAVLPKEG